MYVVVFIAMGVVGVILAINALIGQVSIWRIRQEPPGYTRRDLVYQGERIEWILRAPCQPRYPRKVSYYHWRYTRKERIVTFAVGVTLVLISLFFWVMG